MVQDLRMSPSPSPLDRRKLSSLPRLPIRPHSLPPPPRSTSTSPQDSAAGPSRSYTLSTQPSPELSSSPYGSSRSAGVLNACDTDEDDVDAILNILSERFSPLSAESFRCQLSDACAASDTQERVAVPTSGHPFSQVPAPPPIRSQRSESGPTPSYRIPSYPPPSPPRLRTTSIAVSRGKGRSALSPIVESPCVEHPDAAPVRPGNRSAVAL